MRSPINILPFPGHSRIISKIREKTERILKALKEPLTLRMSNERPKYSRNYSNNIKS